MIINYQKYFLGLIFVSLLLICGCTYQDANQEETATETITFGGYPEDQYWESASLILYDAPGGVLAGAKEISRVSAPLGEEVEIYEIQEIDGTVFYKIGIKGEKGWTTKYIVTGEN